MVRLYMLLAQGLAATRHVIWATIRRRVGDKTLTTNIQFDLIANAKDSLRRAVNLLAWKEIESTDARFKHAITNAAHSIELLLKERLRRQDPDLVWENKAKNTNREPRTVNVDNAISRLEAMARVNFIASDKMMIQYIRKARNEIEHYEWNMTGREAKHIVGEALAFAFEFGKKHLDINLDSEFREDDTWAVLIDELYEFTRAYAARIESMIEERGEQTYYCDACNERTVPVRSCSCELCGHWNNADII